MGKLISSLQALDEKIEKTSPTLGRDATYTAHSRLSRLPSYLTVHMVRFAWRSDIGKKAKIMRKVKFPTEFDAIDLVTDELKQKLLPVSRKLKAVDKEREERRKVRKRTRVIKETKTDADVEMADADAPTAGSSSGATAQPAASDESKGKEVAGGELLDEPVYREKEQKELEALIDPSLKADTGSSVSGLYDLVGELSRCRLFTACAKYLLLWYSDRNSQGCRRRRRSLHGVRQEERLLSGVCWKLRRQRQAQHAQ